MLPPQQTVNPLRPVQQFSTPVQQFSTPVVRTVRSPISQDRYALAMQHCNVMQEILGGDIIESPITLAIGQERPQQLLTNAPTVAPLPPPAPVAPMPSSPTAAVANWRGGPDVTVVASVSAAPGLPTPPSASVHVGPAPAYTQVYTQ